MSHSTPICPFSYKTIFPVLQHYALHELGQVLSVGLKKLNTFNYYIRHLTFFYFNWCLFREWKDLAPVWFDLKNALRNIAALLLKIMVILQNMCENCIRNLEEEKHRQHKFYYFEALLWQSEPILTSDEI